MNQDLWWQQAVIYQIYPRSFYDSNGDGIGDLNGITQKMDYLSGLGVDAIWISPFFKSPMKDFGYDVEDYQAIDPIFGSMEDFEKLLQEAHARNIRVIIDWVLCHTSASHRWFQESRQSSDNPKSDWYIWADPNPDGSPPNNWRSFFGGSAWEWDPHRGQYYLHHFLKEQPNLNFRNPAMVSAMQEAAQWWFDKGVDGLRLDALVTLFCDKDFKNNPARAFDHPLRASLRAKSNPFHLQEHCYSINQHEVVLSSVNKLRELADRAGGKFLMGEIGGQDSPNSDTVLSQWYTEGEKLLHSTYNFELLGGPFKASVLRKCLKNTLDTIGSSKITFALSNHDVARVATRWSAASDSAETDKVARMALILLMTLPGTLCLYQGEELGLTQAKIPFEDLRDPEGINGYPAHEGRDGCRTPLPWEASLKHAGFSPVKPWLLLPSDHILRAVDLQMTDPHSLLQLTQQLIAWRKTRFQKQVFKTFFSETLDPLLVMQHEGSENKILCVFNGDPKETIRFKLEEGEWKKIATSGCEWGSNSEVKLFPYGCLVVEQRFQ